MTRAERHFGLVFVATTVLAAFALAWMIRSGDMGYLPLVVMAVPIGSLVADRTSPALARDLRWVRHLGLVAASYVVAAPAAAIADTLAAPSHRYASALVLYLAFGLVLVPGQALIRRVLGVGREDKNLR